MTTKQLIISLYKIIAERPDILNKDIIIYHHDGWEYNLQKLKIDKDTVIIKSSW